MNYKNTLFRKVTKISITCLVLVILAGLASATEYYVSTQGNNSNNGLILNTPWATPSYAALKVVAGDVIYLVNGTWYGEKIHFINNGTSKKPILIKAYNGTPVLCGTDMNVSPENRGLDITNNKYIIVRGLKVLNYTHPLYIGNSNNISVYDSEFSNSIGGVAAFISGKNTYNTLIDNCSIHDSGWNGLEIMGNREGPYGNGVSSEYITVSNNTIYNNNKHNQIDLFGNVKHVVIKDNLIYNSVYNGIYSHSNPDIHSNITIINNTIYNCSTGIRLENFQYSNITRNHLSDIYFGIITDYYSDNVTICENNISSKNDAFQIEGSNLVLARNRLNINRVYRFNSDDMFILQDAVNENYSLLLTNNASTTIEYNNNQVFTRKYSISAKVSDILYEFNRSYVVIEAKPNGTCSARIRVYPFYVTPSKGSLKVKLANDTAIQIYSDSRENPLLIGFKPPTCIQQVNS